MSPLWHVPWTSGVVCEAVREGRQLREGKGICTLLVCTACKVPCCAHAACSGCCWLHERQELRPGPDLSLRWWGAVFRGWTDTLSQLLWHLPLLIVCRCLPSTFHRKAAHKQAGSNHGSRQAAAAAVPPKGLPLSWLDIFVLSAFAKIGELPSKQQRHTPTSTHAHARPSRCTLLACMCYLRQAVSDCRPCCFPVGATLVTYPLLVVKNRLQVGGAPAGGCMVNVCGPDCVRLARGCFEQGAAGCQHRRLCASQCCCGPEGG